jgi:hypothetical protein
MRVVSSSQPDPARHAIAAVMTVLLAFHTPSAMARDLQVEGVTVAEQVAVFGQKVRLNGVGVRTQFGFRIYVAALYLPTPTREVGRVLECDAPARLQLTLLRDTSMEQNLEALKAGLNGNNSAADLEAIKSEVALFFSLIQQMREVPAGTVIELDYQPGMGTHVRIGSQNLGMIPGERFNRAILKIWLGSNPTQLSLKKALLGIEGPVL